MLSANEAKAFIAFRLPPPWRRDIPWSKLGCTASSWMVRGARRGEIAFHEIRTDLNGEDEIGV